MNFLDLPTYTYPIFCITFLITLDKKYSNIYGFSLASNLLTSLIVIIKLSYTIVLSESLGILCVNIRLSLMIGSSMNYLIWGVIFTSISSFISFWSSWISGVNLMAKMQRDESLEISTLYRLESITIFLNLASIAPLLRLGKHK